MSIKRTGGRKPTMGNWRASIWPRANMQYVNVVISMGICIWMHARYTRTASPALSRRADTRALATCALGLTSPTTPPSLVFPFLSIVALRALSRFSPIFGNTRDDVTRRYRRERSSFSIARRSDTRVLPRCTRAIAPASSFFTYTFPCLLLLRIELIRPARHRASENRDRNED